MKSFHALIAITVLFAFTAIAGCAATPEDRWYQQREALNTANQVYLANTPLMSDEQVIYHGELLQAARSSLDQAHQHLPEGGPAFDSILNIVEAILIRLATSSASPPEVTPEVAPEATPEASTEIATE